MKWKLLFLGVLFWLSTHPLYAQTEEQQLIPSIRELIFPAQPEIRDNFNLFYEIHLEQEEVPKPAFWYKIVFSKDCLFEFTLFPLFEQDHYEFYLYKVAENTQFCEAIDQDRLVSLNGYKYQKEYDNNEQSESFRASLVHIKPIPIEAGDAIYLEVLATEGKNCGHIFDCRTSESSLVTKVINDNCNNIRAIQVDSALLIQERKEAAALRYLSDLFCIERKAPIPFTSIQLSGESRTVQQQNDFRQYNQQSSAAAPSLPAAAPTIKPIQKQALLVEKKEKTPPVSLLDQVLKERARTADSLATLSSNSVKSTATLNQLPESTPYHTVYDSKKDQRATRLQVDKALFSLLLADLKNKRALKREELRQSYVRFKKLNKKEASKRKKATLELKRLKAEKKAIEEEMAITQSKIKQMERLIAKQEYTFQEDFAFEKSSQTIGDEVVYKIQIGVYKNKISPSIFKGLSPVSEDPYEGGVRYSVGAFAKLAYAKQAKKHVVEIGLKDAFIVAYFRGKRMSIQEALQLER